MSFGEGSEQVSACCPVRSITEDLYFLLRRFHEIKLLYEDLFKFTTTQPVNVKFSSSDSLILCKASLSLFRERLIFRFSLDFFRLDQDSWTLRLNSSRLCIDFFRFYKNYEEFSYDSTSLCWNPSTDTFQDYFATPERSSEFLVLLKLCEA